MQISARVTNAPHTHRVTVTTGDRQQHLVLPSKPDGVGSNVNGGELLFLALATCFCNDIYREAAARGITVGEVEVEVTGEFGGRGEPASKVAYRAAVRADAAPGQIEQLLVETDHVAEIQNTLRRGCPVRFAGQLPAP
jgi:uncharacterized OsmC-like protein